MNSKNDEKNKGLESKKKKEEDDEEEDSKFISKGFNAASGKIRPSN
jgi:hypothetical protein